MAEQPPRELILAKILPGAKHLIAYHVITDGRCFATIVGGEPIAVEAGEIIVFTKGDPHIMSSSPGLRADPAARGALDAATGSQLPFFIHYGGDGPASAQLICGFFACDAQPFNPLLDGLPPMQYLAKWRMQIAAGLLSGRSVGIASIAAAHRLWIRGGF